MPINNHLRMKPDLLSPEALSGIAHIQEICQNLKPLLVIKCLTYNHGDYLSQALDGFIMQKTNFPFVVIVHEDASTDGTANILREYASRYPKLILPIFESENQYSKKDGSLDYIVDKALNVSGAKYIAFCEGDDYWTDPLKLQKQVDYLEEHPDCSLVCSNYDIFLQKEQKIHMSDRKSGKISFNDILRHNYVATLTAVIPISVLIEYLEFSKDAPKWSFGDYPIWIFAATKGYIMRLLDTTAVYRILENSASHMTNDSDRLKWAYSEFSMVDYFEARLNIPNSIRHRVWFKRIQIFTPLAISTKNHYLISRISNYYRDNHFYIAWLSFLTMVKFPKFSLLPRIIDSHIFLKAPTLYIRGKFVRNNF